MGFKVRGGAVGDDGGEFFAHELVGFPRRPLDCEGRSHVVACDSLDVETHFEQGLDGWC